ncbi:PEP/pyruvate-binding domain-containing protein [Shewanella sp. SNU WT4]|uniref:PEP/pyruvate-binding domain-containing protein n=1 Tax=Shewanella sp. SNU WT4 TaxID=2590015 RepID=UPI00143D54AF|nr:PEP/pyruvate-binding domain-containing protein [Shewanella sp. SNU WT4]
MKSWTFLSKGRTLAQLQGNLNHGAVLPLIIISYQQFAASSTEYFKQLFSILGAEKLVVRSSYSQEDGYHGSMAGMFSSVLNIDNPEQLQQAIVDVFASYPQGFAASEEVLIQPMATGIVHSGVIFTREPTTGASYVVIADDASGKTDTVTSGAKAEVDTYFIKYAVPPSIPLLKTLMPLVEELITVFTHDRLDIEYGINDAGQVWLFQIRPLCMPVTVDADNSLARVDSIANKLTMLMKPHPFLFGSTTVFGVMPDWNPAEIIGLYPKPLALSLYKDLVTDSTWAYQRNNYGYKNLRSFPLMIDFLGLPYIDVRVSFNSFLPKDLSPNLGHKLVDYYLQCLKDNPKAHDSVEFDIVLSCYTPSIQAKMQTLIAAGFSEAECGELSSQLLSLTNRIIDPRTGLWIQDLHRIEKLKSLHKTTIEGFTDPVSRIYWLLENCKRYGTLPFAGLARAAFIAVQLLQSLRDEAILTHDEYDKFLASLTTVSGTMQSDLSRLSKHHFLQEYGHLRPGTYDITSPRYDMAFDKYFVSSQQSQPSATTEHGLMLDARTYEKINTILIDHGINHSADSLLHFIRCAIEGREYAKFVFTRSLSDAIEGLALLGQSHGFNRDDMAFTNANIINQLMTGSHSQYEVIKNSIELGKQLYANAELVKLPPLIDSPHNAYEFMTSKCEPSFITRQKVIAPQVTCQDGVDLSGKIVLIASADPGYDWIFTHQLKGFVTAFGGCNSHMAIRAAELNIPAVIGAGEYKFNLWKQANFLELDCASNSVRMIQ